jgi:hypothetical protein
MGTSVSHGSPRTVNWVAVSAAYRDAKVDPERVVKELWRAAQSDSAANWADLMASPAVTICLGAALRSNSVASAVKEATVAIANERLGSLAAEIAKRAIVRSLSAQDRSAAFATAVFSEASNYLVSRDLCASFGSAERLSSMSRTISFKASLLDQVQRVVRDAGAPGGVESWAAFSRRVVSLLSR